MSTSGFPSLNVGDVVSFRMEPGNRNHFITEVDLITIYQNWLVDGEGDASVIQFDRASYDANANGIPPVGWDQASDSAYGDGPIRVNAQIQSVDDEEERWVYNVNILDVARE